METLTVSLSFILRPKDGLLAPSAVAAVWSSINQHKISIPLLGAPGNKRHQRSLGLRGYLRAAGVLALGGAPCGTSWSSSSALLSASISA